VFSWKIRPPRVVHGQSQKNRALSILEKIKKTSKYVRRYNILKLVEK
jgi:hypothetical protein